MSPLSRSSLLRVFVGRKWQNFIGLSFEETRAVLQEVAHDLGWEYTVSEESSSLGDRIVLGGGETTSFQFEDQGFTVDCVSASFDPVQRAIIGLVVREETKSKYENATTVLRISPISSETEPAVATFITTLIDSLEKEPWKITHPRFSLSPILQYKTRLFWEYWQSNFLRVS